MTQYFLKLKEWLENSMHNERKSIYAEHTAMYISSYYFTLEKVKELEAEFECKSLAEAGYF